MTDQERDVVEAMVQGGGSFVQQLGRCFLYADQTNFDKLKATFPEYWEWYTLLAEHYRTTRVPLFSPKEPGDKS